MARGGPRVEVRRVKRRLQGRGLPDSRSGNVGNYIFLTANCSVLELTALTQGDNMVNALAGVENDLEFKILQVNANTSTSQFTTDYSRINAH